MEEQKKLGYRAVLKQREYLKIMAAGLINRFGDSIDEVAYTWIVYELTGNAAWSAVIFGANQLPSVLVTPLAGAWVEGRKKKTILVVTDLIRAACVALVATAYLLGALEAWMLLATTLVISTAEAFRGPANTALTPRVLDRDCYEYGMSLSGTLSSLVELIGMAAAAGIIAAIGTAGAIYVDVATFLLSALIIRTVRVGEEDHGKRRFDGRSYLATLHQGFQYVWQRRTVRFIITVCIFLNVVLVPLNSLQAPLASEILGGGAEVISLVAMALNVGVLLGSATYPVVKKHCSGRLLLVVGTLGLAGFYLGVTLGQPLYARRWFMYVWVAALSGLFGYFISLCISLVNVEFVKRTEESYLARVGGIVSALSVAAMPVMSFLVSAVVAYVSTATLFLAMGALALVGSLFIARSRAMEENA